MENKTIIIISITAFVLIAGGVTAVVLLSKNKSDKKQKKIPIQSVISKKQAPAPVEKTLSKKEKRKALRAARKAAGGGFSLGKMFGIIAQVGGAAGKVAGAVAFDGEGEKFLLKHRS